MDSLCMLCGMTTSSLTGHLLLCGANWKKRAETAEAKVAELHDAVDRLHKLYVLASNPGMTEEQYAQGQAALAQPQPEPEAEGAS